jgi:hypothetical protein
MRNPAHRGPLPVVTLKELVALVQQLEPQAWKRLAAEDGPRRQDGGRRQRAKRAPLSERIVRHALGMRGLTASNDDATTESRRGNTREAARLYGDFDLTLVRLFLRLRAGGFSTARARFLLFHIQHELREALARKDQGETPLLDALIPPQLVEQVWDVAASSLRAVQDLRAREPQLWAAWALRSAVDPEVAELAAKRVAQQQAV